MIAGKKATDIRVNGIIKELAALGARGIGVFDGPAKSELRIYSVNGQTVILQVFADGDGYDIYGPICKSNSIVGTIDALRAL